MIFVTVGTQMHFDRLIQAVDEWAAMFDEEYIFAQTGPSSYVAKHIKTASFVAAQDFREHVRQARVIIGHAGMGSILTALEFGKPIIVMPRREDLGEHRNSHQIATANYFRGRILVALDRQELFDRLSQLNDREAVEPISTMASPILLSTIRQFIQSNHAVPALQRDMRQAASRSG